MKNPRLAAPVAVLALAFLPAACTSFGDDLATDEELAADREAAEAMVQAVLDVHTAHMDSRRPARLVMGSWKYVATADTDWSHRLGAALRGLAEEMMEDSPEAPWLLSSGPRGRVRCAFRGFRHGGSIQLLPDSRRGC